MKRTIKISNFSWLEFLETTAENLEGSINDDYIVTKDIDGIVDYFEDKNWRETDLLGEMNNQDLKLYVHFAADNLDDGVICADGVFRPYVDPDKVDPNDEEAYEDACEEAREHMHVGETGSIGFLVSRQGDDLIFQVAENFGGACGMAPCNTVLEDEEEHVFYGNALDEYLNRFSLHL